MGSLCEKSDFLSRFRFSACGLKISANLALICV
jgi:hypothetical protein